MLFKNIQQNYVRIFERCYITYYIYYIFIGRRCERRGEKEENGSSVSSSMLREYLSSYKSLISEIQHLSDREDTMKEVECHSFADFLFSLKYLSTSADSARFFVSRKLVSFFYASVNFAYMFPFIWLSDTSRGSLRFQLLRNFIDFCLDIISTS